MYGIGIQRLRKVALVTNALQVWNRKLNFRLQIATATDPFKIEIIIYFPKKKRHREKTYYMITPATQTVSENNSSLVGNDASRLLGSACNL